MIDLVLYLIIGVILLSTVDGVFDFITNGINGKHKKEEKKRVYIQSKKGR